MAAERRIALRLGQKKVGRTAYSICTLQGLSADSTYRKETGCWYMNCLVLSYYA